MVYTLVIARIVHEAKLKRSVTLSVGLLTVPSDNKPLYSVNIIYKPYEENTYLKALNERDKLIRHGGIKVSNALIPRFGK